MMEKIYTKKAPDAIGPYSQAVKCGSMLYTSGQIAIDPATGNVEAQGIEAQTRQICENLKAVLAEAGCTFDNVVKTTCFLDDMNDFAAFNAVYGEYFTNKPARSCVEVSKLPKGVLAEIEVIAEL
ncbi:MAG: RidA family protein [Ruminococcus sp.]|nr:RidA family protein [Ruminococcus sp.]